jgi:hypothetical protein
MKSVIGSLIEKLEHNIRFREVGFGLRQVDQYQRFFITDHYFKTKGDVKCQQM